MRKVEMLPNKTSLKGGGGEGEGAGEGRMTGEREGRGKEGDGGMIPRDRSFRYRSRQWRGSGRVRDSTV